MGRGGQAAEPGQQVPNEAPVDLVPPPLLALTQYGLLDYKAGPNSTLTHCVTLGK